MPSHLGGGTQVNRLNVTQETLAGKAPWLEAPVRLPQGCHRDPALSAAQGPPL